VAQQHVLVNLIIVPMRGATSRANDKVEARLPLVGAMAHSHKELPR